MKNAMLVILYRPSKKMCTHSSPTGGVWLKMRAIVGRGFADVPFARVLERPI
jgi:hypothetical protein